MATTVKEGMVFDTLGGWLETSRQYSKTLNILLSWKENRDPEKPLNVMRGWKKERGDSQQQNILHYWKTRTDQSSPHDSLKNWAGLRDKGLPQNPLQWWRSQQESSQPINAFKSWLPTTIPNSNSPLMNWSASTLQINSQFAPMPRAELFLRNFSLGTIDSIYLHDGKEARAIPQERLLLLRNRVDSLLHWKKELVPQKNLFLPYSAQKKLPHHNFYQIIRHPSERKKRKTLVLLCDLLGLVDDKYFKNTLDYILLNVLEEELCLRLFFDFRHISTNSPYLKKMIPQLYRLEESLKKNYKLETEFCNTQEIFLRPHLFEDSFFFEYFFQKSAYDSELYHLLFSAGVEMLNFPLEDRLADDIPLSPLHSLRLYRQS